MTNAARTGGVPEGAGPPRYRAFGTFRLLLALIVLFSHSAWIAQGTAIQFTFAGSRFGSVAVFGFFILSGYIMSEAADTFYVGKPWNFGKNRVLKIVPPFLAALVFSLLVHGIADSQGRLLAAISFEGYKTVPSDMFGFWNLAYNLVSVVPLLSSDFVKRLTGSDIFVFVRYIWAVRVEVLFYAVMFLFILLPQSKDLLRKERRFYLLLGFAAFMLINQFVYSPSWDLQFAPYFLFGVLVYFGFGSVGRPWLVGTIVVVLMMSHASQFQTGVLPFSPGWLEQVLSPRRLAGFLLFGVLIAMFLVLRNVNLTYRVAKLDRMFGDLSYSLYLNHYAVLAAFSALSFVPAQPELAWIVMVIVCIAVAAMLQQIVERPLAAVRDRVRGQRILEGQPVALDAVRYPPAGIEQHVPPNR